MLTPIRTHVFDQKFPVSPPQRRATVLVVDDEEPTRQFLTRVLEREGYVVHHATNGRAALQAIDSTEPDVVVLDVVLPEIDGFEVCRRVRSEPRSRLTPIIMVTGFDAQTERVHGLSAGADDFLAKPFDIYELVARVRSLARVKRYADDLDSAGAILANLAAIVESRYGHSSGHCYRMANYATSVGRLLEVSDGEQQALYRGAFLHDIGMLAISDAILQQPGPLSDDDYETVKSHPSLGDAFCANLRSLQAVRPIIRWHHERVDGSGYPDGLRGNDIPVVAQIVGVVEMYEALTSPRPYQERCKPADALVLLRRHADRGWLSGRVVDAMTRVVHAMHGHTVPTALPA